MATKFNASGYNNIIIWLLNSQFQNTDQSMTHRESDKRTSTNQYKHTYSYKNTIYN